MPGSQTTTHHFLSGNIRWYNWLAIRNYEEIGLLNSINCVEDLNVLKNEITEYMERILSKISTL